MRSKREISIGIYAIIHVASGRRYVGSSCNIAQRFYLHARDLNRGMHHCRYLQNAWKKYGADAFELVVLENVFDVENLISIEQKYLDSRDHKLFNTSMIAGRPPSHKGLKRSIEHRKRISMANIGHVVSPETRTKISEGHRGKKLSESHKAKLSIIGKGRPHSLEHRQHISKALSGRRLSEERCLSMSAAMKGKRPPNYGKPMSEAQKVKLRGRIVSEDTRTKLRLAWDRRRARKAQVA